MIKANQELSDLAGMFSVINNVMFGKWTGGE